MKGTMYRKSRYFTLSAHSQSPAPSEAPIANAMKSGSVTTRQSGRNPYQNINSAIRPRVIRKSANAVITELPGTISRGKYTFEIRLALPTRLVLDSLNAVEKNCHGNMAANTSSAYG